MNPSAKASYDKINQYRQKIKQTIMSEQSSGLHGQKQQLKHKQPAEYPKMTSSISRSNIRKNPVDVLNVSRNLQTTETHRIQDDPKMYGQKSRVNQPIRIEDRAVERSRIEDRSRVDERNRIDDRSRVYEHQNKLITENSRIDISTKTAEYLKSSDIRTTMKPSTSKSPTVKTNPYLQDPQTMTKRKNSVKEIQKSTPKPSNPAAFQKTPSFHNLSAFDTFSPRITSGLPPLFGRMQPSTHTAEHQVKVLLQENQILSLHLNQKMQRIKGLEKELKSVVKSQILHEERFDIEVNQLNAQNSRIKKSSEQQLKTLVMEVKKLNDELVEKEQEWQQRVNMIRKTNLQEQQEMRKNQMKMEDKYKSELDQLKIKYAAANEQLKTSKQISAASIQSLKNQLINLNQSTQKLTHLHKMQKSQLSLQHDQQLKSIKQELYRKIQILNLDKMRKETELNSVIDSLTKELKKTNQQLEDLKHESEFSQVKDMQMKGRMMIEIREEKEKIEKLKNEENNKLQKLTQAELQAVSEGYEHKISQLQQAISNLQSLLQSRSQQITNLYKQLQSTRNNYHSQVHQKDKHIHNLQLKLNQLTQQHLEQQQCMKIKLAELTQTNQKSFITIYQNKISQQQHLLMDKEQIISRLREKIATQIMHAAEVNQLHQKEIHQYRVRIQEMELRLSSTALKEKNTNALMDKENMVLKENLMRQSQTYEKVALVKEQSIKRLQDIIQTKDKQIQQLQSKIQLLKKSHKTQLHLLTQQSTSQSRQQQDIITQLKQQLQYTSRQLSKRSEQFFTDKQYFSNQMHQLKAKNQTEFTQSVEKILTELSDLKVQNQELKMQLAKVRGEYEQYKKLWNQEETLNKLLQREKQFVQKMNQDFTIRTQKLIQFYQQDIEHKYKPQIFSLNQLILEKDSQILDMKTNYHQLEMKFEKFIEEKQIYADVTEKVLTLGKNNDSITNNFVGHSK